MLEFLRALFAIDQLLGLQAERVSEPVPYLFCFCLVFMACYDFVLQLAIQKVFCLFLLYYSSFFFYFGVGALLVLCDPINLCAAH